MLYRERCRRTCYDSLSARFFDPVCRFPPHLLSSAAVDQHTISSSGAGVGPGKFRELKSQTHDDSTRNFCRTAQFRNRHPCSALKNTNLAIPSTDGQPFSVGTPVNLSNSQSDESFRALFESRSSLRFLDRWCGAGLGSGDFGMRFGERRFKL